MPVKFHLKENGEPGRCTAKPGSCPITAQTGGKHYDSKAEAEKDYERMNMQNIFSTSRKERSQINRERRLRLKKSKRMSYALRHHPEAFSLDMAENGSVNLDHFSDSLNISKTDIKDIAEKDGKQRFVIRNNRIWAAQGHSFPVRVPLDNIEQENAPDFLYHGTKTQFLNSIFKTGLLPQKRQYVHLSRNKETAMQVADRRNGNNVILIIDVRKMMESGARLMKSENNVYLTDKVSPEFITTSFE